MGNTESSRQRNVSEVFCDVRGLLWSCARGTGLMLQALAEAGANPPHVRGAAG